MFQLSELQHDALLEIFNLGVGQAAAAMSRIVKEEVT
ncbi:MAG: chemotaxis protein CheC, partial [Bacillota bacterium]